MVLFFPHLVQRQHCFGRGFVHHAFHSFQTPGFFQFQFANVFFFKSNFLFGFFCFLLQIDGTRTTRMLAPDPSCLFFGMEVPSQGFAALFFLIFSCEPFVHRQHVRWFFMHTKKQHTGGQTHQTNVRHSPSTFKRLAFVNQMVGTRGQLLSGSFE